jgi:DNA-binding NarL/FixJ family response regulator
VELSRSHAAEALALAEAHDYRLEIIRTRSVLGFVELSLGNARAALEYLGPLPELTASMGLLDPGVFPFVPDMVEAMVSLGELKPAEALVTGLEERGRALHRPLALATAGRCRGLIAARAGGATALDALAAALEEHERVPQPFELARTLLIAGEVRRRHKQKRPARDAFQAALEIFDGLGARLWADRTRDGLRRVGEGVGATNALTPTEQRVAELVAEGRTNREVAEELFVSVKTVEANLSRIFHKVGVRSRTELARRI